MNARILRVLVYAMMVLAAAPVAAQTAEVYVGTSMTPMEALPGPIAQPRQPVLFVHGHNALNSMDTDFNYRKNFHDDPTGALTSFQATLDAPSNAWLGIEAYYIRFEEQRRSIVEDAQEIADAVERILHRHDPNHTPGMANPTTPIRVAIVGYSKGTISSRLYLKSLHEQLVGLPAPRPGFNPISTFVAISPPNHGLAVEIIFPPSNVAAKQLNNGYTAACSTFWVPAGQDFIENLNGHPIEDTLEASSASSGPHPTEAPGSRPNGAPLAAGTLYVCLFAGPDSNGHPRDFVGGSLPSDDCQGRILAANLAPDAVNQEVDSIPDGTQAEVHQDTPHTPEVICRALSTIVHHRAPPEEFVCALDGEVPRIPPRTAVDLVLDLSGSMLSPASPGGTTKLAVLKEAVEIFCQLYAAFAGPGDRLGAVYFGTQPSPLLLGGEALVPVTDANVGLVIQDVSGRQTVPGELTALGGGLVSALDALGSPAAAGAAARHIVLFTDGMQNVPPQVSQPPPPLTVATAPPTALDTNLGVAVHTIGVGAASPFVALLTAIAGGTGGTQHLTVAADDDLREFFVQVLVEALKGNSPELVDYRRGTFSGAGLDESFAVGKGARRLVLKLSWRGKSPLRFQVTRDGVDVTSAGRFVSGGFYRLFIIDLPATGPAGPLTPEGNWTMRITGDGSVPYEAALLVDEPRLEIAVVSLPRTVRAGEPIELRAALLLDGTPLVEPATVRARIFKPAESAGTLLSRSPTPAELPAFSLEGSDPAQRKLALLLGDRKVFERLQPTAAVVGLAPDGDQMYSGAFPATDVPGLYRVDFEVEVDTPATGRASRRATATVLVRLGKLDVGASELELTEISRAAGVRNVELSLRPRDVLGNLLGPGWGSTIAMTVEGRPADIEVRDELDGTYTVGLIVPEAGDPPVTLTVEAQSAFAGPLSGFAAADPGLLWWAVLVLALVILLALVWVFARRRRAH